MERSEEEEQREFTEEEQREILRKTNWIPTERIGKGGGARVFKVTSRRAARRLKDPLLTPLDSDVAEKNALSLAETLGDLVDGAERAVAAAKVASKVEARTRREIDVLRSVSHPNLVPLLDYDDSDAPRWYVMPYYRGGTLEQNAARYEGDVLGVFRGLLSIAGALARLHETRVVDGEQRVYVHRDVKPKNIFIRQDGKWVLGDPGVAYETGASEITRGTTPISRDWFPRWFADRKGHAPAVDVYMLAATGVYLLCGDKALDPSWLAEDEFNLTMRYPGMPGVEDAYAFLKAHLVGDISQIRSETALELCEEIRRVIRALEIQPRLQHVFSWIANKPPEFVDQNQYTLGDIAVLLPASTRRLRAKVRVARSGDAKGRTKTFGLQLGRWTGPATTVPISDELEHQGNNTWTKEIVAELDPPLEAGWHQFELKILGQGEVSGLMLYAECDA